MNSVHRFHVFAFTDQGKHLKRLLKSLLEGDFVDTESQSPLKDKVKEAFLAHEEATPQALIFIGATGIAVRSIKDAMVSKFSDPPVIVMDDLGQNVIPLISGHYGNANALALEISEKLTPLGFQATPIITTATDLRGHQGFEPHIKRLKILPDLAREALLKINTHIANGKPFAVFLDPRLRLSHALSWDYPEVRVYTDFEAFTNFNGLKIAIGYKHYTLNAPDFYSLISQSLVLGTGLRKNLETESYLSSFDNYCLSRDISPLALESVYSITLKSEEAALKALCKKTHLKAYFLSIDLIAPLEAHFEGSDFVKSTLGVSAVAGPCAYFKTGDDFTFDVQKKDGCTFSLGRHLL